MPSQLLANDAITFVVAKPFTSRGKEYAAGDDFPQEDARDIDTFVRARYVIPVLENPEDKQHIRHWHKHIRPKDEVLERLSRDRTQLLMPLPPDSDAVVDIETLTHPHTTPDDGSKPDMPEGYEDAELPSAEQPELPFDENPEPPESLEETYDPAEHNVDAVQEYIAEHPEQKDEVLAMERAGRGRKGLLEE